MALALAPAAAAAQEATPAPRVGISDMALWEVSDGTLVTVRYTVANAQSLYLTVTVGGESYGRSLPPRSGLGGLYIDSDSGRVDVTVGAARGEVEDAPAVSASRAMRSSDGLDEYILTAAAAVSDSYVAGARLTSTGAGYVRSVLPDPAQYLGAILPVVSAELDVEPEGPPADTAQDQTGIIGEGVGGLADALGVARTIAAGVLVLLALVAVVVVGGLPTQMAWAGAALLSPVPALLGAPPILAGLAVLAAAAVLSYTLFLRRA